ncbi:hypothetical protein ACWEKU_32635, partial [Streptomyces californicus]
MDRRTRQGVTRHAPRAAAPCGKTCSPERLAEVRRFMGLDQPVWR